MLYLWIVLGVVALTIVLLSLLAKFDPQKYADFRSEISYDISWFMSIVVAVACATGWLYFALLVAKPQYWSLLFSFDLTAIDMKEISNDFFAPSTSEANKGALERAFIPLLIVVDVVIMMALKHLRMAKISTALCLILAILYIGISGFLPQFSQFPVADDPMKARYLAALSFLWIARYLTYVNLPVRPCEAVLKEPVSVETMAVGAMV